MRILVAGATGVIGRRVVPQLLARGHSVTAVARTPDKRAALQRMGAAAIPLDVFAPASVRAAVSGHDVVVNLATHIPPSTLRMFLPGAWRENDRIRREGSANLVDAALAAGSTRFVQESFGLIYPDRGDAWIDESTPLAPVRYNRSVLDAERSAQRFTAAGGIGVVLRFAGFYGPDSASVLDFVRLVRRGWAALPGSPDAFISSASHDDAAAAVVAALEVGAGTYNVCDDEPVRHREYIELLAAAVGAPPPRFLPAWAKYLGGSLGAMAGRSLRLSNRKFREASAWKPRYRSVREGWPATVAALREAGRALELVGATR